MKADGRQIEREAYFHLLQKLRPKFVEKFNFHSKKNPIAAIAKVRPSIARIF